MKKLVLFLSALVVFASCQKKEYATFQKSSTPTYAVVKKQVDNALLATPQPATEGAVVVTEETIVSAPTESTIVADNSSVVASTSLSDENVATQPAMVMNEPSINAEFEKLNKLEQYVAAHEGTTLEDVKDSELTKDLNLDTNVANTVAAGDLPANIPAFWWGCVLSWVGVLIVYLVTDKDKDQTKKALMGCLIGAGIYIIFWVVYYGLILSRF
jgi:hypothetical protein